MAAKLTVRQVAVLTAPRPGPRHGAGTFNLERSNPGLHEGFRKVLQGFLKCYKDLPIINLELPWRVAKGAVSEATYRKSR